MCCGHVQECGVPRELGCFLFMCVDPYPDWVMSPFPHQTASLGYQASQRRRTHKRDSKELISSSGWVVSACLAAACVHVWACRWVGQMRTE